MTALDSIRAQRNALQYRADIDGLRAVAVVPILLFHCNLPLLPGGFVGVDIFFVISGFLITSVIVQDMEARRFSILGFYRRRVVRIFPALLVMLGVTLAAGVTLLLPSEISALARSAAAAAGFIYNIVFWRTSGYFDAAAETRPLLHSWSLGVEEQFYLLYPLFLLLLGWLVPRGLRACVALVTLASFGFALYLAARVPAAGFFLLPGRAWELGVGALIAMGAFPKLEGARARNIAAIAGLALLALAFLFVRADFAFPAPWGLLPCGGTALLISYGQDACTAPLLVSSPMRAIGRISYSLYLWHWPIITFYRLLQNPAPGGIELALLVLASFAAAILSWYLVERPFLRRFRDGPPLTTCLVGIAVAAAVAAGALFVAAHAGRLRNIPPEIARIDSYFDYRDTPERVWQFGAWACDYDRISHRIDMSGCFRLDPAKRNVLLLGDSHAAQFSRILAERQPDIHIVQATAAGCRPILGSTGRPRCVEMVETALGPFLTRGRVHDVVLAGRWRASELEAITRTVRMLRGRGLRVTVLGPIVEYHGDFPALLARAMLRGDSKAVALMRDSERASLDVALEPRVRAAGGQYVSMQRLECPAGACRLIAGDGAPYQWDYGHLTLPAARELAAQFPRL